MIFYDALPPGDQWDQAMWIRLLDGTLYPHGLDIVRFNDQGGVRGLILMVPGRYYTPEQVTERIEGLDWVLALRTGDEEDTLDVTKVEHDNIRWWVQTPWVGRNYGDARFIPLGFPPHFNNQSPRVPTQDLDVFLSAQDTHPRRHECFEALGEEISARRYIRCTAGFTQGLDREAYAHHMRGTKIAPCPAGPATPDTFRVYEALECHAVPFADDISASSPRGGYWQMLFPDGPPFPIYTAPSDLSGWTQDQLANWPYNANRIAAWWMRTKRDYAQWLRHDLEALGVL